MKQIIHSALLLTLFSGSVMAADVYIRIRCDADSSGAQVFIDDKPQGSCPVDLAVPEGAASIRVVKDLGNGRYSQFVQNERFYAGTSKRIDVVFDGTVLLTEEGRKAEDQRLAAEQVRSQQKLEEQQREERARVAAANAAAQAQAARQAAIEAKKGNVQNFFRGVNESNPLTSTTLLLYSPLLLPLSTTSDVLQGKDLAANDPAAFANPDSMMARVQRNAGQVESVDATAGLAAR